LLTNLRRASRGRTIVIVTHRLGVLAIADRVLCLADGHVVQEGKPGQIAAWTRAQRPPSPGLRPHLSTV
jgi:ABC-type bacteriocin/lantibiotic exporter with double-glycine peptidase domain